MGFWTLSWHDVHHRGHDGSKFFSKNQKICTFYFALQAVPSWHDESHRGHDGLAELVHFCYLFGVFLILVFFFPVASTLQDFLSNWSSKS
ncbi:hypothetical protein QL285_066344 [Trifolium repens]|nr:hypothetical protein QL285_066344 [Trifolium repens]